MRPFLPTLLVLLLVLSSAPARATSIEYAQSVVSTSGSFSGAASSTLGAPDGAFIQLAFGSSITLDFGSVSSSPATMLVFTFDDLFPAFADVALSDDLLSFVTVGNTSDANGTPGSASIAVAAPFRYVRITDDGTGDPNFPAAGFDLDAVGRQIVPEPALLVLLTLGLLAIGAQRTCRSPAPAPVR